METQKQKQITIEFNGTSKVIPEDMLPKAREIEASMQSMARKAGDTPQEIADLYTLRIVKVDP